MKTLKLEPHLEVTEIFKKLSLSQKSHHRCYWQILLSVAINPDKRVEDYAAFLGVSISKIYRVVRRYNSQGSTAFDSRSWGGRRKGVELLTLEEEAVMMASIKAQAMQGHVLTMHDIRSIVETRVNQTVSDDYLWDLFKRHDWKKKLPRPEHPKKDQQAQEAFKKKLPDIMAAYAKLEDERPLKLFFEDEASFGRISGYHRCWTPKSDRARVKTQQIREYLYAFTAVCPETGETCSIISPVCNTNAMQVFLDEASHMYSHYRILMVLDSAAWHTTQKLIVPENIKLLPLPPYSPELNPTEHIWDYLREQKQFNNHIFESLDDVEAQLVIALNALNQETEKLKSMCQFSWIKSS